MAVRAVSFCEVLKSQQVVNCVQSTAQRYNFFDSAIDIRMIRQTGGKTHDTAPI